MEGLDWVHGHGCYSNKGMHRKGTSPNCVAIYSCEESCRMHVHVHLRVVLILEGVKVNILESRVL